MAKPFVKLRSRIMEADISHKELAEQIHIDPSTLSKKLMALSPFTADEMYNICDILNVGEDELNIYFPRRQTQILKSRRNYHNNC